MSLPRFLCLALLSAVMACLSIVHAAPGDLDAGFSLNANSSVYGMAAQPDGKVIITGSFTTVGSVTRNHVARINPNGTLDTGFNPDVNGTVYSTAVLADGKVLLAGNFSTVGGVTRNHIARVHADGTLDTAFNANLDGIDPFVYCTLVQPDGKILIGGNFTTLGGVARNNVARLNADGTLDASFNPNANDTVYSLARQADGKILIAGRFIVVGGLNRNYLARVDSEGVGDSAFNATLGTGNGYVYCMAVQADGRILLGGDFGAVRAIQRSKIARINADSTLDTGFNPNANSTVYSMALQTDGKIVIGGGFSTVGVVTRNRIARLNADGTTDAFFNPNVSGSLYSTLLHPDGKILIGGSFSSVGGTARTDFARLDNDAATQSLTVQGSTRIEWLRGGSSPEALEVAFERSTDGGVVWSPLGTGTRISGGWELTGLGLPAGGLVRARTRVMGGYRDSSGSLLESIAPFGVQPEIAVEQPALTDIADGGSKDFGNVQAGSSGSLTFTIRNTGTANLGGLAVTIDGTNAADFSVTAQPAASVAGPNGSTTFTVNFAPTGGGAKSAALHIASNDFDESPFDINLTGTGTVPDISVLQPSTSIADGGTKGFGNVLLGGDTSLVFTIRNTGTGDLTGLGITIDGANASDFSITETATSPVTGPSGSTTFTVRFAPSSPGAKTAVLHIASNVAGSKNPYDITLTGTGITPEIVVEQPALTDIPDGGSKSFPTILEGTNTSLTFTIRNTGNTNLTGLGITIDGANAADFAVTSNPAATVAGPSGTTTFIVRFAPATAGAKTATLHIANNDLDENPFDIVLTGTAVVPAPEIVVEQPALTNIPDGGGAAFPNVLLGSNTSLTFTLRNTGTGNLTGLGITIDGANASEFSVTTPPTAPVAGPSGSTTFVVHFAPTTAGARTAALHIASNDADESPFDINLTGTGVTAAPEIVVEQPALTEIQDGEGRNFGSISPGSFVNLTFTLRNTGNVNLTGLGITINGTNAADFTIISGPTSPIPGPSGSTTFIVRFTAGATGLRTAALHISNNDADENPFDILLTGTGSGPGNGDVTYNPDADGHVLSTSLQPDGKVIVGGAFETIGGVPRNYIARLNADGTLDPEFNPDANDWVYCTAVQPDGKILVGGSFTTIGGVARKGIARLNADGSLDTGFAPAVNGWVYCMTVRPDGKILIGGSFSEVAGSSVGRIARLNANGSLDTSFGQYFNGDVYSLALQEDGKIVVGGDFTDADGIPCNYLARLKADGQLDGTFDPNPNGPVFSATLQPDGKLIISGDFTTIGGTSRNRLARLNSDGSLEAFSSGANGDVECIVLQANGKILIGGSFTVAASNTRNYLARLNADGSIDSAFNPNANGPVYSAVLQGDGKILIGGDFTSVGNLPRNRIMRLDNEAATQALTLPNSSRVQWVRGGASPEAAWVSFDVSTNGGSSWTPLGAGSRSRLVSGWELAGLSLPANGQVRARAYIAGGYSNGSAGLLESTVMVSGFSAPEISIEQPALTLITNGGAKDFGNAVVAGEKSLVFTVRNTGNADLTGLGITFTGANAADFSVSATPVSPVAGSASTTFTVKFSPATAGMKTATLRLASNDADENPFDIILTGRALISSADEDGDGILNGTEVALAALGFDPVADSSALRALVQANAAGLGLTGGINEEFLALGSPVLEKNPTTGKFHLRLSLEKSTNLSSWSPLLGYTPTFDAINGKIDIEITPSGSNAEFLRVFGAKP